MNQLLKLSMISKLGNKEKDPKLKAKEEGSLKELGSSMAKDSLKKILVKV